MKNKIEKIIAEAEHMLSNAPKRTTFNQLFAPRTITEIKQLLKYSENEGPGSPSLEVAEAVAAGLKNHMNTERSRYDYPPFINLEAK